MCQKSVLRGEFEDTERDILHDGNDRGRVFGADDLRGHAGQFTQLIFSLFALRDMHVHLVAVVIGIVARRAAHVQPKRVVIHDSDSVRHHAHLVE